MWSGEKKTEPALAGRPGIDSGIVAWDVDLAGAPPADDRLLLRLWRSPVTLAMFVAGTALFCIWLLRQPGTVAPVWLPNALVIGWLSAQVRPDLKAAGIASFIGQLAANLVWNSVGVSLAFSIVNTAEVLLAFHILRSVVIPNPSARLVELVVLQLTIAAVVTPAISGLAGAAVAMAAFGSDFWSAYQAWWSGDSFGIITLLPMFIAVSNRRAQGKLPKRQLLERCAALMLSLLIAALALHFASRPFIVVTVPLVFIALRYGFATVAVANGLHVTLTLVLSALEQSGTFLPQNPNSLTQLPLRAISGYTVLSIIPPLIIGAISDARRASLRLAVTNEENLRSITNNLPALIARMDSSGRFLFVNARFRQWFGKSEEQLIGRRLADFLTILDPAADRESPAADSGRHPGTFEALGPDHRILEISIVSPDHFGAETDLDRYLLATDVTAARIAARRLEYQALHDSLTELPNRLALQNHLDQILASSSPPPSGAILFLDLDRFKTINDSLGHHVGDQLLRHVADSLSDFVSPACRVFRHGGDEFIVVILSESPLTTATDIAASIIERIGDGVRINAEHLPTGASVGLALFPEHGTDRNALLQAADAALYRAKGDGRGRLAVYTPELLEHATRRLNFERDIRRALQNNEFILHFLPRVRAADRVVIGYEALVRWVLPDGRTLMPGDFLEYAVETNTIHLIDIRVLDLACGMLASRSRAQQPALPIAVNASLANFQADSFQNAVADALKRHEVAPELLEIEINESQILRDLDHISNVLTALRELGVRLAIDNFGTGYSSLNYLFQCRFDTLKIDRSVANSVAQDHSQRRVVESIVSLAHSLGYHVVAEGVESAEQANQLAELGCDDFQGFLFGPTTPIIEPLAHADS